MATGPYFPGWMRFPRRNSNGAGYKGFPPFKKAGNGTGPGMREGSASNWETIPGALRQGQEPGTSPSPGAESGIEAGSDFSRFS